MPLIHDHENFREGLSSERNQPIRFAGSVLGARRHVCAFFHSHDEEYRVLLPFIREGFERSPAVQPGEVGQALNRWLTAELFTLLSVITNPGELSIARFGLGLEDEVGVVVAGSRRADFPTEIETTTPPSRPEPDGDWAARSSTQEGPESSHRGTRATGG